jgi:hypothetical protein
MELKREYLTSSEIASIVGELVQHESAVDRHIIGISMVAQTLIDGLDKYETCNKIYDKLLEEGIDIEMEVINYYLIDKLVKEELGIDSAVRTFLEQIGDKLKNVNLDEAINQLKGVMVNGTTKLG